MVSGSVLCGKNQWPTLGDFRQDYIEYIRHMNVLGDLVLKATGFGATGDENTFAKYCSDPVSCDREHKRFMQTY